MNASDSTITLGYGSYYAIAFRAFGSHIGAGTVSFLLNGVTPFSQNVTFPDPTAASGAFATFALPGGDSVTISATGLSADRIQIVADGGGLSPDGTLDAFYAFTFTGGSLSIDVDGNANYDALTDGLLIIRYLFGLTGTSLTNGAIGTAPTRSTPTEIMQFLDGIKSNLDVDGNGQSDALTDGLLILRFMFGLRGSSLTAGAVDPLGTRTTSTDIETYIQSLMPQ
ncbi:MAG: hypothetical protein ACMG6H_12865 [Acidobacteriota bacterium]